VGERPRGVRGSENLLVLEDRLAAEQVVEQPAGAVRRRVGGVGIPVEIDVRYVDVRYTDGRWIDVRWVDARRIDPRRVRFRVDVLVVDIVDRADAVDRIEGRERTVLDALGEVATGVVGRDGVDVSFPVPEPLLSTGVVVGVGVVVERPGSSARFRLGVVLAGRGGRWRSAGWSVRRTPRTDLGSVGFIDLVGPVSPVSLVDS
jgi:hypothetical protein